MKVYIVYGALLSGLLTSCGGGLATTGTLSSGSALMIAGGFVQMINNMKPNAAPTMPSQGLPSGVTTSAISASSATPCVTVNPDPGTDADNDGIAAERHYTFDCDSVISGGDTYTYKGTLDMTDLDDTKKWAAGGYTMSFDSTSTYEGTSGTGTYGHVGTWKAYTSGDGIHFDSDYKFKVKGTNEWGTVDYVMYSKWESTLHGVDETQPWDKGTYDFSGYYQFVGTFVDESAHGNHEIKDGTATLNVVGVDLVYDNACTKYYKSGSYKLTDAGGNTFEVRYDCTTAKGYLNGDEVATY